MTETQTFIYPPTVEWSPMRQRPQQLAKALGARGHLFYFCDKVQTPGRIMDCPHPNVYVQHNWTHLYGNQEHMASSVLFNSWSHHVRLYDATKWRLTVFDWLDAFPQFAANDMICLRKADIVLCTSQALLEQARAAGRTDAHLVPNGVELEHWSGRHTTPEYMRLIPGPRVLFAGSMNLLWVDRDLIVQVAQAMPDVQFVFCGVDIHGFRSSGLRNIHHLGHIPYDSLPPVYAACQAAWIPFKFNPVSVAADPVKSREYAAAGLPFVSTDLPEVTCATWLIHHTLPVSAWVDALRDCLRRGRSNSHQDHLTEDTWACRAQKIESIVSESIERKAQTL